MALSYLPAKAAGRVLADNTRSHHENRTWKKMVPILTRRLQKKIKRAILQIIVGAKIYLIESPIWYTFSPKLK